MAIRKFDTLVSDLKSLRTKAASTATPESPEKDDREKGKATIPVDPAAAPAKQNVPESKKNDDSVTPVLAPPTAAKASLNEKAAALAKNISSLLGKTAAEASKSPLTGQDAPSNPHDNGAPAPQNAVVKNEGGDPIADKDAGKSAPAPTAPNVTEKKVEVPKADDKGPLPPEVENKDAAKQAAEDAAALEAMAADPMFLAKVATVILKFEEGRAVAQQCIERECGRQIAEDTIKAACFIEEYLEKAANAEQEGIDQAEAAWQALSPEEQAATVKLANFHELQRSKLATDLEKQAYDAGAGDAAGMADAGMMGEAEPPAEGAGGEQITIEDIAAVLAELVQSGKMQPEEAQSLLQALSGGGEGGAAPGGPEGGMPPGAEGGMPPGAGAPPMGEPDGDELPPEASEEEKEAHVLAKQASAALALLNK